MTWSNEYDEPGVTVTTLGVDQRADGTIVGAGYGDGFHAAGRQAWLLSLDASGQFDTSCAFWTTAPLASTPTGHSLTAITTTNAVVIPTEIVSTTLASESFGFSEHCPCLGCGIILNPGDTYVIEPGGNTVPPGGIDVAGGTLTIRDDAVFDAPNPLTVSSGSVIVESGTTVLAAFDELTITGGFFEIQAAGRIDVQSGSIAIGSGVLLSKAGAFGPAPGDFIPVLTVKDFGALTHPPRHEPGLSIQADAVTIEPLGTVDVTGKGLLGGETYDDLDQIVAGASAHPVQLPGEATAASGSRGNSPRRRRTATSRTQPGSVPEAAPAVPLPVIPVAAA